MQNCYAVVVFEISPNFKKVKVFKPEDTEEKEIWPEILKTTMDILDNLD